MTMFTLIALGCVALFLGTLVFDDFDFGDALHFGDDGSAQVSLRTMLLFGVGFGAGGMLMERAGYHVGASVVVGAVLGFVIAGVGMMIGSAVMKQESNSVARADRLVGRIGRVTVACEPGQSGEIVVQNELGHYAYHTVQSSIPLAAGERVEVTGSIGDVLWVIRAAGPQPQGATTNGDVPKLAR